MEMGLLLPWLLAYPLGSHDPEVLSGAVLDFLHVDVYTSTSRLDLSS